MSIPDTLSQWWHIRFWPSISGIPVKNCIVGMLLPCPFGTCKNSFMHENPGISYCSSHSKIFRWIIFCWVHVSFVAYQYTSSFEVIVIMVMQFGVVHSVYDLYCIVCVVCKHCHTHGGQKQTLLADNSWMK